MKNITSRITVEVLGSPKDHVEKALNLVIDKLKNEKNSTSHHCKNNTDFEK